MGETRQFNCDAEHCKRVGCSKDHRPPKGWVILTDTSARWDWEWEYFKIYRSEGKALSFCSIKCFVRYMDKPDFIRKKQAEIWPMTFGSKR